MPQHFAAGNFDPEFVDALVDIFEETCALWLSRGGKPLSKAARDRLEKIILARAVDGMDLATIRFVAREALDIR